ncbi:MAG: transglycosylase domain-containing protein, partial [Patescibacteria group bacterium]
VGSSPWKGSPRAGRFGDTRNRGGVFTRLRVMGRRAVFFVIGFFRNSDVRRSYKKVILQVGGIVAGAVIVYLGFLYVTLPDVSDPKLLLSTPAESTVITDRDGTELYRLFAEQDRTYVESEQMPQHLQHAFVAIEDERYYDRGCIDIQAVARAVIGLGRSGGASTITRQLARNALNLKGDSLLSRKLKEFLLGCQLERLYSKDELLELYLNWIPFGSSVFGVEQAAQRFFGASASQLSLAESAVIAGLPQRPTYFSPYGKHVRTTIAPLALHGVLTGRYSKASEIPDEEITIGLLGANIGTGTTILYIGGRSDQVLRKMQDIGFISEQERLTAITDLEMIAFEPSREDIRAPHFVLWVRDQVAEILGSTEEGFLERGGLNVETTLDWEIQEAAENVVAFHREDVEKRFEAKNIAALVADPHTGDILGYVGNTEYSSDVEGGQIDMVHAPRQPGSSFKSFIYAAAFLNGYSPATILADVPTKLGDDEPQNFDGQFWGLVTIRRALAGSRNVPAAKAFFLGGGEDVILALVENLGMPTPKHRRQELSADAGKPFEYGWPLALGAAETPLLEMVQGYSVFANAGKLQPLHAIRKITDRNGNIVYEWKQEEQQTVLDPRVAYQITSVLSDTAARPNEYWQSVLNVPGYPTAAKTGTSNKCLKRDDNGNCTDRKPDNLWTIGYTPTLAAGVWVGNADSSPLSTKAESLSIAAPIWKDILTRAHKEIENPVAAFPVPEGIVMPQVSLLSGELATECTPVDFRRADIFLAENAPKEADPACVHVTVDKVTGLLASDSCPEEAREEGSFLVLKSVLAERFPEWQRSLDAWGVKQVELYKASESHSGSLLPLPVAPTEECDPSLTPGRLEKPKVAILYPQDNGSATFPSLKPTIDFEVGSTVRQVEYLIDGKSIETVTAEPWDPPLRVPRSVQESGTHTLEVRLTDEYYNVAKQSVQFRFEEDTSGPSVRLTSPVDGATIPSGADITLRATAEDDGGIKVVQFYLNERLLSNDAQEPYALDYPGDLRPGNYTLSVKATDFAGNEAKDEVEVNVVP